MVLFTQTTWQIEQYAERNYTQVLASTLCDIATIHVVFYSQYQTTEQGDGSSSTPTARQEGTNQFALNTYTP